MDDLISRRAAIDALDEQIEQCNKALGSFDISPKDEYAIKVERASLKAYRELLENLPSAQPERAEGEWIPFDVEYECSHCGIILQFNDGTPKDNNANFCPNCGARMKGYSNETD